MKTLILGASNNPSRYSYKAAQRLINARSESPVLIGGKKDEVFGLPIHTGLPDLVGIHTVTIYLKKTNQLVYVNYLLEKIRPKRIIFNPGAENAEFALAARNAGIIVRNACTLVLLATGQY